MAIAISVPTAATTSSTDTTSYSLGSFTPAANALLVVEVFASGTVAAGTMTDSGNGYTWTRRGSVASGSGSTLYLFTAQAGASPAATVITFNCTGDAATGCIMSVCSVTGHDQTTPLKQALVTNTGSTSNPTVSFGSACTTTSGVIVAVGVNRTSPAYTEPSGFTENCDTGYSTPNTGMECAYRATGETGTTMTWTGASGTWASIGVEIAVSAGTYVLTANSGSYSLSGKTTGLLFGRLLAAVSGSYTLTGQTVNLVHGYVLTAVRGTYTLTGQTTGLLYNRVLAAVSGSYALTGQTVNLLLGRLLTAVSGSYALTGQAVNFLTGKVLSATSGAYALTGQAANLLFGRKIPLDSGSYTLTGEPVDLIYVPAGSYIIRPETGHYALTGEPVTLTYTTNDIDGHDPGPFIIYHHDKPKKKKKAKPVATKTPIEVKAIELPLKIKERLKQEEILKFSSLAAKKIFQELQAAESSATVSTSELELKRQQLLRAIEEEKARQQDEEDFLQLMMSDII